MAKKTTGNEGSQSPSLRTSGRTWKAKHCANTNADNLCETDRMEVEMSAKEFSVALDDFRKRHGYSFESALRLQRRFLEDLGTVSHTEFLRKLDQNAAAN